MGFLKFSDNRITKDTIKITSNIPSFFSISTIFKDLFNLKNKTRFVNLIFNCTASTSYQIKYYLGGSTGQSIDHFIYTNAGYNKNVTTTITLAGSNDDSSFTTIHSATLNTSTVFKGKYLSDYLAEFSPTATYKIFRITLVPAITASINLTNFCMGLYFAPDSDPETIEISTKKKESDFISDTGNVQLFYQNDKSNEYAYEFYAITESELMKFIDIYENSKKYSLYYKNSNPSLLNSSDLLNIEIANFTYSKLWTDYYTVKLRIREVL